jgi:hypothetical protein
MLTGPEAVPVTDAGTFATEAACQASITAAVPSTLEAEARADFQRGERRYICVKVKEARRT